jgi:catechol 2,3-dioxygenase-like lactoylglutathione lyase family enzyme
MILEGFRMLRLAAVTLDCDDPVALAEFYRRATGLMLDPKSSPEFSGLRGEDGFFIGFQRVEGYRAPSWPNQETPQQLHMDFTVDDLDEAEALVVGLGATKAESQAGGEKWRVFLDPAGHPFCLSL